VERNGIFALLQESCPIADNLILNAYHQEPFSHRGIIRESAVRENASRLMAENDIRAQDAFTPAGTLSGGNPYPAVIVILRGAVFSTFGNVSLRTPSFSLASIFDWSMTSERVN